MPHLQRVIVFFSSRRRHTRWPRDWSSDVCSSDLYRTIPACTCHTNCFVISTGLTVYLGAKHGASYASANSTAFARGHFNRSEERRVGKEGKCLRARGECKDKRGGWMMRWNVR